MIFPFVVKSVVVFFAMVFFTPFFFIIILYLYDPASSYCFATTEIPLIVVFLFTPRSVTYLSFASAFLLTPKNTITINNIIIIFVIFLFIYINPFRFYPFSVLLKFPLQSVLNI